ncbi:hypothetical protein EV1_033873 [Malus domestica]
MAFWEGYVSDEAMGTFAPIVVYWLYTGVYQLLPPLDNYRLHTRREEDEKNSVPLPSVVKGVLLQQLVQATVAQGLFLLTSRANTSGITIQPSVPVQIIQIVIAMLVMDTWQFFVHRYMHQNKFLYRHVHSQHHRLVVPYAIGALYNHLLEGLLLDTFRRALSFLNNTTYHDIHHQLQGLKYNYSQPFFPIWDKLFGTYMPYNLVKRPKRGFEARAMKAMKD